MNNSPFPIDDTFRTDAPQLDVPPRLLLGPGPANAHPRVLQAMGMRQVGYLDPAFVDVMNDINRLLRYVWQTSSEMTIAVSGTGSAAMEAAIANTIEAGDKVIVGVMGYFGERMVEICRRYGAEVTVIEKAWGEVFSPDEIRTALETHRPALLGLVHAETSTGALQPLDGIGELCREFDCLLLADTVTSLGAAPTFLDKWGVDIAYSCSQKGLGCSPGASPLTFGERALAKINGRSQTTSAWYLDINLLAKYWRGDTRAYHHTASSNSYYGLREGLRLVHEEGIGERWQRHQANAELFWQGAAELGLELHVSDPACRIPSLTTVRVPDGVDAKAVTNTLLHDYNIEIGNGFSKLAGKVWRVGLMGFNSRPENVFTLLAALRQVLG